MISDWIRILRERSVDEWADAIARVTLKPFKCLLARSTPPSISELEQLGNIDTCRMGVYLDIIRQVDGQGKDFLYAGSSASDRGLEHRQQQHRRKTYSKAQA